jgi:heterodisulfide reductase subunit C/nitrate reductase gamma subunit
VDYSFFNTAFYVALAIFLAGMAYRIYGWASREVGEAAKGQAVGARAGAMLGSIFKTIFSPRIFKLIGCCFMNVCLLGRSFKQGYMRWIAHMFIFYGFMLLLILHALEGYFVEPFSEIYASTLNPWIFLRDFFGFLVIFGVILAVGRRLSAGKRRGGTASMDVVTIIILAVIMCSGFWLKATKIGSEPRFDEMCEQYLGETEGDDYEAVKQIWARDYNVVFADFEPSDDPEVLSWGWQMNQDSCVECHSRPQGAVLSNALAFIMEPLQNNFNAGRFDLVLWYIHWLACFAGLAWLPFSKFLHVLTTPVSILVGGISEGKEQGAELANRRAFQLDACTHCGACSEHCSVAASFDLLGNSAILPSEKLVQSKGMLNLKDFSDSQLFTLCQGSYICTSCNRCTEICPSGINLQDLWAAFKEELLERGYPEPYITARQRAIEAGKQDPGLLKPHFAKLEAGASYQPSFDTRYCFDCLTCTNACPVVANYKNPQEVLGMLPHQIIHSMRLGLKDMALNAAMTWDCLTCYACQEACPQQVPLADVLYELRNEGFARYVKDESA